MTHPTHPVVPLAAAILFTILAAACTATPPTGVDTDDVRGTWSGTFTDFSLLGRTLTGDADWTFTRDEFEIIFFNPPEGQAERIQGKWKFTDGKIAVELTSSFPIDTDIGARDTLFVSILRNEMSLKTLADSSILLFKTRSASLDRAAPGHVASVDRSALARPVGPVVLIEHRDRSENRADIGIPGRFRHPPS